MAGKIDTSSLNTIFVSNAVVVKENLLQVKKMKTSGQKLARKLTVSTLIKYALKLHQIHGARFFLLILVNRNKSI